MKTTNYSKLAINTTIISFVIGTALFFYFKITHDFDIVELGLIYIPLAFGTNLIILFMVLMEALNDPIQRKKLLLNSALMLLNIPIAVLYLINL